MRNPQRRSNLIFALLMAALLALPVLGFINPAEGAESAAHCSDAGSLNRWKSSLVQDAITSSSHLYQYPIGIAVSGTIAVLSGTVGSEAERSLAEQIANSIHGINSVENQLIIGTLSAELVHRRFAKDQNQFRSDAVVTTKVKSQLLAHKETRSLDINVDTSDRVVTLTGQVRTDIERELAYYITRNTGGVRHVVNKLEIGPRV